jgi:hypothetical protein
LDLIFGPASGDEHDKLIEELATISIAEFDVETRFRSPGRTRHLKKGLEVWAS